jgi:hypothetical protein
MITVITPTTGTSSLDRLIKSMDEQDVSFVHILLWDNKREDDYLYPDLETLKVRDPYNFNGPNRYSIVIPDSTVKGFAYGSALRSIGLMAAQTEYVTFADSDVWWEKNHLSSMLNCINGGPWAYCKRKIWANENDYIGIDNFESVGDEITRKVPYEMVDNNCMIFSRRLGASGAVLYRETKDYNDDRLFYKFLKQYGGIPNKTNEATINQVCPKKLEKMFRENCEN